MFETIVSNAIAGRDGTDAQPNGKPEDNPQFRRHVEEVKRRKKADDIRARLALPVVGKVEAGKRYVTRDGHRVTVTANESGWYDGLPFVVELHPGSVADAIGLGAPDRYTVDETGRVWRNGRADRYDLVSPDGWSRDGSDD